MDIDKTMIQIETIGERKIAIKGIGRLLYEQGLPLSFTINELNKRGVEVSLYHVMDELKRNGWSNETIHNRIRDEGCANELNSNSVVSIEDLHSYIWVMTYQEQRQAIFDYLFGDEANAKKWFNNKHKI